MQGQSPYLINAGLFYKSERAQLQAALLYNIIGKRIIGVGRSTGTTGEETARVPDSYEMPRHSLDLTMSKKFWKKLMLKLKIANLLGEKVYYKQFAHVTYDDGSKRTIDEITRRYNPGRNISLTLEYNF